MITFKEFGEQALPPPPPPAGVAPAQPAPLTPEQIEQQQQQLRAQQGLASLTGSRLDKIVVNPEEKPTKFQTEQTLIERTVNLIQRRKRAMALRRRMPKMKMKRKILRTRLASNDKLKQRAMRMAKQNLRRRIAGARGVKYNSLSAAEKINIDNRLKGREAQIRNMARRMMPTVRKGEQKRLYAVQTGRSTKGVYSAARNINSEYLPIYSNLLGEHISAEDLNNFFSMYEATIGQNLKSIAGAPFRVAGNIAKAGLAAGALAHTMSTPRGALGATLAGSALAANKLSKVGKIDNSKSTTSSKAPELSKNQKELQKQAVIQSKQKTELGKISIAKAKQSLNPKDQQKADQDKANALGDIKKTVNQKIGDFNKKNKGKSQIATYTKVGSMPAKQTSTANTSSSIIIPQTYKTKTPSPATTIVSHREWDHGAYLQEKANAALAKKAEKYGVTFEEVKNVFEQGLADYDGRNNATAHQFAMQRVNSHLAEGGLWDNIHAKRKRIARGSGEKMRKPGSEGAPTKQNFIDAQEAVQPKSPRDKFKDSLKKHGYDADKGADRLLNLIAKQKKQREEHEKKYAHLYAEATQPTEPSVADKIVSAGATARKALSDVASNFRPFDEKSYQDRVKTKKQASGVTKESIDESFVVDRASGYSGVYTAADLGMKIQGGFELHPSVMEEGGAGDEGTDKLTNKYKKDTPGEAVEAFVRMMRAKRKANNQC
jgi:hypothetical protein